jgi:electron transfer flavoprotein beta subunit
MGPPQAIDALQEAISMGTDEAILLTDPAFAGADTLATAYTLGKCVEKVGQYDLVICGRQAIDGDTAQVGPQVAEYLDIPQITYVSEIEIDKGKLIAERAVEGGYERVECKLPALLTVVKELNTPRYPAVDRMIYACSKDAEIKQWNAGDIGAMADRIGLTGSPTMVKRTFTPDQKRKAETLSGDKDEVAQQLLERLKGKKLI